MPASGSGIFNQAMMEIGATACLPNGDPLCGQCPWKKYCLANRHGSWDHLPVRSKGKPRRIEERTVFIVRNGSRVVIDRRPDRGLLAGLYEFPNVREHLSEEAALAYAEQMGYEPLRIRRLEEARHIFSHVEWRMIGYEIRVSDAELAKEMTENVPADKISWPVDIGEISRKYAIPSAFAAYAKAIQLERGPKREDRVMGL